MRFAPFPACSSSPSDGRFAARIKLAKPLGPTEVETLEAVGDRHGFSLAAAWDGVDRTDEWKGLSSDEEFARLKKSPPSSSRFHGFGVDFAEVLQLRSNKQLLAVIRWLREVEEVLPNAEFTVSEDHTITEACRPSEVDIEALSQRVSTERRSRNKRSVAADASDDPASQAMMKAAQAEVESVENTLERARRDFAIWKASQKEAVRLHPNRKLHRERGEALRARSLVHCLS